MNTRKEVAKPSSDETKGVEEEEWVQTILTAAYNSLQNNQNSLPEWKLQEFFEMIAKVCELAGIDHCQSDQIAVLDFNRY